MSERGRISNQGLSNARYCSHDLPDQWWRPRAFKRLADALPATLYALLAPLHAVLLVFDEQVTALSKLIEVVRPGKLPTGMGALTAEVIDREVGDWNRFQNRRQVAGYTGLIPSENSSGEGHKQGSISKHGNPRVRHRNAEDDMVWSGGRESHNLTAPDENHRTAPNCSRTFTATCHLNLSTDTDGIFSITPESGGKDSGVEGGFGPLSSAKFGRICHVACASGPWHS